MSDAACHRSPSQSVPGGFWFNTDAGPRFPLVDDVIDTRGSRETTSVLPRLRSRRFRRRRSSTWITAAPSSIAECVVVVRGDSSFARDMDDEEDEKEDEDENEDEDDCRGRVIS